MNEKRKSKRPSLGIDWYPESPPPNTETTVFTLRASDGAAILGTLYRRVSRAAWRA